MVSFKVFVAHNGERDNEAQDAECGPTGPRRSAAISPLRARHKAAMVLLVLLALAIAVALFLAFAVVGLVVAVPVLIVVGVGVDLFAVWG